MNTYKVFSFGGTYLGQVTAKNEAAAMDAAKRQYTLTPMLERVQSEQERRNEEYAIWDSFNRGAR